jgi:aconitate hydratase
MMDSFRTRASLVIGERQYEIRSLCQLERTGLVLERLPFSLRILLENMLRHEDGLAVTADDIRALIDWRPGAADGASIDFIPERVLLQDFTGVPALVDLAAMRDAMTQLGGDPARVNPMLPVELVVDHSIQVDAHGSSEAVRVNADLDYRRNGERYAFLRWGQHALRNFDVVPPHTGICHQVNLEHLARVVCSTSATSGSDALPQAYPDTLVGTDSHTTMINGLGVLGWGVGGIEAEAAMLGQAMSMTVPEVIGVRLSGELAPGATATDLVLTITELLRGRGVVGRFVEFCGPGLQSLGVPDRATISNMCPEYGATCALFPIDRATLAYLRASGRGPHHVELVERYAKAQGLFHEPASALPDFSDLLELDLGSVRPSVAGPRRPQDRISLSDVAGSFQRALPQLRPAPAQGATSGGQLSDGSVVIAAITSCTNTSNPSAMLAAGLLAKNAVEAGLERPEAVKTSLAPGSQVVSEYLRRAGLTPYLDRLGFSLVGYGCTTCIGNSGPLSERATEEIEQHGLVVCAVLSGNRNFEARIHPLVRANYLMSPPLVIAYALAGRIDVDLTSQPLGRGKHGKPVFLRDIWPEPQALHAALEHVSPDLFTKIYGGLFQGDERWTSLAAPQDECFGWEPDSTYVRQPPYFSGMSLLAAETVPELVGLRALAWLGDSVTTDHISPAGAIRPDSPAGRYLRELGVRPADFNSYGARRGNHEVMTRGTFANSRIRNRLTPELEGGITVHHPSGELLPIYDAAMRYAASATPLLVLAGKEYGSGSSRDWAAKGPALLGVRAVIAQSFERIHRSNLVGMGILPLQFRDGESAETLELSGRETFATCGLSRAIAAGCPAGTEISVDARDEHGRVRCFQVLPRIDTMQEALYLRHGGILQYTLRQLMAGRDKPALLPGGLAAAHIAQPGTVPAAAAVDEGIEESFPASDPPSY